MVSIEFSTDNAAFDDENFSAEIARILRKLAKDFEENSGLSNNSPQNFRIRDSNGNKIGWFHIDACK